jgi:hypothetical protein
MRHLLLSGGHATASQARRQDGADLSRITEVFDRALTTLMIEAGRRAPGRD